MSRATLIDHSLEHAIDASLRDIGIRGQYTLIRHSGPFIDREVLKGLFVTEPISQFAIAGIEFEDSKDKFLYELAGGDHLFNKLGLAWAKELLRYHHSLDNA